MGPLSRLTPSIYNYLMARLPNGTPATPAKVRLKQYREELRMAGGRRVIIDLESEGAKALECLRRREGVKTIKDAITQALLMAAR
jgi:molybdenum cofactor biosynthesis enzyme MoaA